MDELYVDFVAETRETLEILSSELVLWEKEPRNLALIDNVFRFVHTVKGSCGFLDLPRLLKLSHAAEELLSTARDQKLTVTSGLVSSVLAIIDRISALTDAVETGASVVDNDAALIRLMLSHLPDEAGVCAVLDVPAPVEAPIELATSNENVVAKSRSVRVGLSQLDKLMNCVSDLVLARNEVSRHLRTKDDDAGIEYAFSRLSTTVTEIRETIGVMRMQHIDRLFSSLPRMLRDISVDLGKQIEFALDGGDVEIDREMVECLRDPLTHIIRNAADHGIEAPEDRIKAGKNPVGTIKISARQSGNQVLIDIADDGRGIDLEKLGQRAISKKMLSHSEWLAMDEAAQLNLVFAPGLSTADTVTSISGRGVGMDVVYTNLKSVGATVELFNETGRGLRISLRLPLTLTIVAALTLRAGENSYSISRAMVSELISASSPNVQIENIGGARLAKVRGKRYVCARLNDILAVDSGSIAESLRTLVILRPTNQPEFALEVDAVLDTEELVVKPAPAIVMASGIYAGTTLPDSGRPMLLLDVNGLANAIGLQSSLQETRRLATETTGAELLLDKKADNISVLLFRNVAGVRQAIRLSAIERMEDIPTSKIRAIGGIFKVAMDDIAYDVLGIIAIPPADSVSVLRLSIAGRSQYLVIDDVIDIHDVVVEDNTLGLSVEFESVVMIEGEPIGLLSASTLVEHAQSQTAEKALCFLEPIGVEGWETLILEPLLKAAGYRTSQDPQDRSLADVIFSCDSSDDDDRIITLLSDNAIAERKPGIAISCDDQPALIAAIEARARRAA